MKRSELAGTGQVFGFTFRQCFKGKANVASLVVVFLLSLFSLPLMTAINGRNSGLHAGEASPAPAADTAYVVNGSGLELELSALAEAWPDIAFVEAAEAPEEGICLSLRLVDGVYHVEARGADEDTLSALSAGISTAISRALALEQGADPQALDAALGGFSVQVGQLSDYTEPQGEDWETVFVVQYAYSILVLILCVMSTSYMLRTMVEEKSSKLVELLLVSVAPLALLLGKILAMMCYIFVLLLTMGLGLGLSYLATDLFMGTAPSLGMFQGLGFDLSGLQLGLGTVVLILIALLLGYFTFSLLSGIAGSGCSSMEDVEPANLGVVFLVLGGYLVSCVLSAIESQAVAVASALIPIVSVFCAPVQYVTGNIGLGILLLSFAIQGILVAGLAVLGARVYKNLVLYKGERLKLRRLLAMAKKPRKEAAAL